MARGLTNLDGDCTLEKVLNDLEGGRCKGSSSDKFSSYEQGKVYAEFVGTRHAPHAFLLHRARRGKLSGGRMRRVLQNPDRARKIAADWRVIDEEDAQDGLRE